MFTWNNFPADHEQILGEVGSFMIYQHELGENGTNHLQGYVEFSGQKRISALKKINSSIHWESRRGTQQQAIDYCSKEDTRVMGPWEHGQRKAQGARSDLEAAKAILDAGGTTLDIADSDFGAYVKYNKAFDRYKREITPTRNWGMQVYVYWGPPGTGKTRKAFEEHPDAFFKPDGEWWDGYTGQDTVVIDDFYGGMRWCFLLKLLDRYPLAVPFKGGFHQFVSKTIIFTSNVDICDWYDFEGKPNMKIGALERRITQKIHFDKI